MWRVGLVSLALLLSHASAWHDRELQSMASSTGAFVGSCQIEENVDYIGMDLDNDLADTAEECCPKCQNLYGCTAFTWSDYQGGTCWFKTARNETKTNNGVRSARVTPGTATPPPPFQSGSASGSGSSNPDDISVCSIRVNVDFEGNDIGHAHARQAEECCGICQNTPGCKAFSWTKYQGGKCWLKGAKGKAVRARDTKAAVVAPLSNPPTSVCTLDVGVNYVGNDLHSLDGFGVWDCCNECAKVPGCRAYTWTNDNSGTCWFKSAKNASNVVIQAGASSGTLPGNQVGDPGKRVDNWKLKDFNWKTPINPKDHIQYKIRAGKLPIRAANLGSWFVGEYWMSFSSPIWDGAWGVEQSGEYVSMLKIGHKKGDPQFDKHRQTWIQEKDIRDLASAGINTVRIPVGYWIVDDDPSATPSNYSKVFAPGGLKYLDRMINIWAYKYNIAVMLSLHAHQGSQNGNDHSAPFVKGKSMWGDSEANFNNSIQFATVLAHRYKNSPAFLGMGLMNEPIDPSYDLLQAYYEKAYKIIREDGNDCILTIAPKLGDQGTSQFNETMVGHNYTNVWVEWHVYFKWGLEALEEPGVIKSATKYANTLTQWTGKNPIFLGEWSLGTAEGAPFKNTTQLQELATAQLESFKLAKAGWSFWTWKNDEELFRRSGWSMREMLRDKIMTVPKDGHEDDNGGGKVHAALDVELST